MKINKYEDSKSVYFQQAFYLKGEVMQDILEKLEIELEFESSFKKEKFIKLVKLDRDESRSFNYTFLISNQSDFLYAKNLLKLNKNFVKPFLKANNNTFSRISENYNRFFALISTKDNEFTWGKSVHFTNHTNPLCVHTQCGRRNRIINFNYGHLSHFRKFFKFKNKAIYFSVKQLFFDFNYFSCFVKPVLNKYKISH